MREFLNIEEVKRKIECWKKTKHLQGKDEGGVQGQ